MNRFATFPFVPFVLFDTPDSGGSGGAANPPAGGGSQTPPASPAAATTPTPPAGAPPAAPPAQTTGQFTYQEDRSRWIPPHRLQEETAKRQQLEAQYREAQARIAALAGVTPPDPNAQRIDEVKAAFLQVFPHLKPLLELPAEQIAALVQTPETANEFRQAEQRQWKKHGETQINAVAREVAEALGVETLDDDQKSDLRATFKEWLARTVQSELRASGNRESATLQRYEDGDETLISEFAQKYTKRWVEPARRQSTVNNLPRTRPTPNSSARTPVTSVQRPEKFESLDARLDYAAKLAKERGVQFGR